MNQPFEPIDCVPAAARPVPRRGSRQVAVRWGGRVVPVGGEAPVVVQSMTNTDTADAIATAVQVKELAQAGSEIVRITVNSPEAAAEVAAIREQLDRMGVDVPLVGDFHYNGHKLLTQFPECAQALSKYRINPGNVGKGARREDNFAQMIEVACRYGKPVRIGVNWGSLDQELLARMMDENAGRATPWDANAVLREALVRSAIESAERAEELGLPGDRICLSAKVSGVQDLIAVYRDAGAPVRLPAAPRPDGGRDGQQGHRRVDGGARGPAAGRHRRHDPRVADAGARGATHARGPGGAGDPPDHGPARVHPDGRCLPRLRPDDEHVLPGTRRQDPDLPARSRCRPGVRGIPASSP